MDRRGRGEIDRTDDRHAVRAEGLAASVSSQLPPVSAAMSTITAPGFIPAPSPQMMRGALRPGTAAS
jgi:hypothetical protein